MIEELGTVSRGPVGGLSWGGFLFLSAITLTPFSNPKWLCVTEGMNRSSGSSGPYSDQALCLINSLVRDEYRRLFGNH